ncbi:rRNA maturation RNase YbeY [Elongatibacter sediminis]|uniref:Endoribonuclease YbeY n=1 Tax=Elongatibacter sediminis TaxID=3119006 RepID=A0AAW9RH77_9GAMM
MDLELDLQIATNERGVPDIARFESWVRGAAAGLEAAELTVRVVGREESARLNERYRSKTGPTNVLSFPAELPAEIDLPLLGDIVICAPLVDEEARAQGKEPVAHWAHLVVHGVLHLRGYDHEEQAAAEHMEGLEKDILESLGFSDPYA